MPVQHPSSDPVKPLTMMTSPSPLLRSQIMSNGTHFEDKFPSQQHTQLREIEKLDFCQLRDWNKERIYNESPAKCTYTLFDSLELQ